MRGHLDRCRHIGSKYNCLQQYDHRLKHQVKKFLPSDDSDAGMGAGSLPEAIRYMAATCSSLSQSSLGACVAWFLVCHHGGCPVIISTTVQPTDHTSARLQPHYSTTTIELHQRAPSISNALYDLRSHIVTSSSQRLCPHHLSRSVWLLSARPCALPMQGAV